MKFVKGQEVFITNGTYSSIQTIVSSGKKYITTSSGRKFDAVRLCADYGYSMYESEDVYNLIVECRTKKQELLRVIDRTTLTIEQINSIFDIINNK